MKIQELHIGMAVRHPQHGIGIVKSLTELNAEIRFDDALRTIVPEQSDLAGADPRASLSGLDMPLAQFIEKVTRATLAAIGVGRPDEVEKKQGRPIHELNESWSDSRLRTSL